MRIEAIWGSGRAGEGAVDVALGKVKRRDSVTDMPPVEHDIQSQETEQQATAMEEWSTFDSVHFLRTRRISFVTVSFHEVRS